MSIINCSREYRASFFPQEIEKKEKKKNLTIAAGIQTHHFQPLKIVTQEKLLESQVLQPFVIY